MNQVIYGKVPSKSNTYKIVTIGGHSSLAKTPKLKEYENSFYLQCNGYRNKGIKGLFELTVNVFNESQRPDLDNAFKVILDSLQHYGAITNDRNCIKITAQKFVDKKNPRIEFNLIEIK